MAALAILGLENSLVMTLTFPGGHPLDETRDYIRYITENFEIYKTSTPTLISITRNKYVNCTSEVEHQQRQGAVFCLAILFLN